MTEQQVSRMLKRAHQQRNLLNSIKRRYDNIRKISGPYGADPSMPPISGGEDKDLSYTLAATEEQTTILAKTYYKELYKMRTLEKEIYDLICLCKNEEAKSVLIDRFINDMAWDDIAREHNYSRACVFDYRQRGIQEIAKKSKNFKKSC